MWKVCIWLGSAVVCLQIYCWSLAWGSVFVSINVASSFVFLTLFVALLVDPSDIRFLLFGIFLVCLLKLLSSIFVRCNLLLKKLWQKVFCLSTWELQMKFLIEIDYIVNRGVHPLTATPGFQFPRFWRELYPLLLLLLLLYLLVPSNFLMPRVLLCDLILLFVLLLLSWMEVKPFNLSILSFAKFCITSLLIFSFSLLEKIFSSVSYTSLYELPWLWPKM